MKFQIQTWYDRIMSKRKDNLRRLRNSRGAPELFARHVIGEFKFGDHTYHEVHIFVNPFGGEITLRSTAEPYKDRPSPVTAWYTCDQWNRMYAGSVLTDYVDGIVATLRKGEVPRNLRFAPTTVGVLV